MNGFQRVELAALEGEEDLGERIAALQKELGLSPRDLEKKSRSLGFIGDIEAGRTDPSFEMLVKLWQALGVDPNRIITGEADRAIESLTFTGRNAVVSAPDASPPAHGDVTPHGQAGRPLLRARAHPRCYRKHVEKSDF